ncbi:transcription elongation regulator 1-like protein [Seriola dumerili]|uniref:transcription elongation regulator 1-like protein n=1 Tax=Seriola dumerili TaxID=41447 RepID=UPI000BBEEACD|nr:transcription elongation regulator 1-like protein [Seriola dumerili]
MVTTTMPWLSVSSEPAPQWLWLASWSAATYQATPPLVLCPPAVWIPEHAHVIQWERPAVEVVPLLPPFYRSSPIHHPHRLPKLVEGWISPEEVGVFQRRDKHLLLTNQIIQKPEGHAPRNQHLLFPSHLTDEEEEGSERERKDKRPVASTPVPGSPWCVVWTGDDRVFFFNPTIHLSVWERPGDLIGRDISRIIEDPPHKRKKTLVDRSSSCQSSRLHGNDEDDEHEHSSKRNRIEEPMSLVPRPGEVQLLPLELRIAHFREMMLERRVSAFSTWEKELHKMVFDPRYLLLTSDQRKQVFDQFVKSRVKDEYKENKSKLQKAREEFRQLLEEAKISNRSTFKEFCARYRGDQRFNALNRKKEQEVLFNHYITSLNKRDKENRARLKKMR